MGNSTQKERTAQLDLFDGNLVAFMRFCSAPVVFTMRHVLVVSFGLKTAKHADWGDWESPCAD